MSGRARPAAAAGAVPVVGHAVPLGHEVVEERVAGARVEGERVARGGQEGQVADAAEVEHDGGPRQDGRGRARARWKAGTSGAPCPARRDVRRPEVRHDVDPAALSEAARRRRSAPSGRRSGRCRTVWPWKPTDLQPARPPRDGRPTKPRTASAWSAVTPYFGFRQRAGAGGAILESDGVGEGAAQQRTVRLRVGDEAGRPEGEAVDAVRVEQGEVDAVHRCAAHEAQCQHAERPPSPPADPRTKGWTMSCRGAPGRRRCAGRGEGAIDGPTLPPNRRGPPSHVRQRR